MSGLAQNEAQGIKYSDVHDFHNPTSLCGAGEMPCILITQLVIIQLVITHLAWVYYRSGEPCNSLVASLSLNRGELSISTIAPVSIISAPRSRSVLARAGSFRSYTTQRQGPVQKGLRLKRSLLILQKIKSGLSLSAALRE